MLSIGIGIIELYLTTGQELEWLWMKFIWLLSYIVPNIVAIEIFYGSFSNCNTLNYFHNQPLKLKDKSLFADTNKYFL